MSNDYESINFTSFGINMDLLWSQTATPFKYCNATVSIASGVQ
jgi:hypothetical protein